MPNTLLALVCHINIFTSPTTLIKVCNIIYFIAENHFNSILFHLEPYHIDKNVAVVATPGHTGTCISVIVKNTNLPNKATVAIAGDLFEKEEDIFQESLWIDAGSEHELLQRKNRLMIAEQVEHIIPGHGPIFKVTKEMREKLKQDNLKKD